MALSKSLITQLKKEAHHLRPVFQIGKAGLSEDMVDGISGALDKRELMKVSILQNCSIDKKELAFDLSRYLEADVVQIIGRTIVLYRRNPDISNYE